MYVHLVDGYLQVYDAYEDRGILEEIGFKYSRDIRGFKAEGDPNIAYNLHRYVGARTQEVNKYTTAVAQLIREGERLLKVRAEDFKRSRELKKRVYEEVEAGDFDPDDYHVPKGVTVFEHQKVGLKYFSEAKVGALFGDCGIGKTVIAALTMNHLLKKGEVKKILIVCPISIMEAAWAKDLGTFTPDISYCLLEGTTKRCLQLMTRTLPKKSPLRKKFDRDFDVYILNYDKLKSMKQDLIRASFDMIIFDESQKLRNRKTATAKAAWEITKNIERRIIMTGTPFIKSEVEYFSQMKVVDPQLFGPSFALFRNTWFVNTDPFGFNWELSVSLQDAFTRRVDTKALRFKADECVDLPGSTIIEVPVKMNKRLSEAYKLMKKESLAIVERSASILARLDAGEEVDLDDDALRAVYNPLTQLMRLRQLANSYSTSRDYEGNLTKTCWEDHKLSHLKDFVTQFGNDQVIIWTPFVHQIETLLETFGDKSRALYGKTSKDITDIVKSFKAGEFQYLICNPKSVAFGHTWTNCHINIFYCLDYDSLNHIQAKARTLRISQKKRVLYYYFLSVTQDGKPTIDHAVFDIVQQEITDSKLMLDLLISKLSDYD